MHLSEESVHNTVSKKKVDEQVRTHREPSISDQGMVEAASVKAGAEST